MARLESQAKLGYFPAPSKALEGIISHLNLGEITSEGKTDGFHIIDPCCGEGAAIKQIATGLEIREECVYAVELDAGRGEKAKELLGPKSNVLTPASFMGTRTRGQSMGLAYVNPPFDLELGGGKRQEQTFVEKATGSLKHHGILVLVMPVGAIQGQYKFQAYLDSHYEDAQLFLFPPDHRRFKEVVYIARRRKAEAVDTGNGYLRVMFQRYWKGDPEGLPIIGESPHFWMIPSTFAATYFDKIAMTREEMEEAVENSPLNASLLPPKITARQRPPMPLYKGHVALLLASGMLDGVVKPDGEHPHVVRGTARKVDFLADKSETKNYETGAVTAKEVWSQRIVLTVRTVALDGTIQTFEDGEKKVPPVQEVPHAASA